MSTAVTDVAIQGLTELEGVRGMSLVERGEGVEHYEWTNELVRPMHAHERRECC